MKVRKKAFILSLLFLLTGCTGSKNESLSPEQEAQLKEKSVACRQYSEGDIHLLEANDTIYWYDPKTCLLNYLDESDMTWHILCGKPNCDHTVETVGNSIEHTSDCDAFIGCLYYTPLGFYDGRIYYIEGIPTTSERWLSSLKPDGTDHKRGTKIEYYQGTEGTQYYFHYGRLYVLDTFYDKDSVVQIYTLNDQQQKKVTIGEGVSALFPVEDYIYYMDLEPENRKTTRIKLDGSPDALSLEYTTSIGVYYSDRAVYYYLPEKGLFKTEYNTGKEEVLWNGMDRYETQTYYLYSDGTYLYLRGGSDECIPEQGDMKSLLVFDMDGNLVRDMEIVNQKEALEELREKINSETDTEKKKYDQKLYSHSNSGEPHDAFFGSIGGYVLASGYGMPNQYIKIEELASDTDTIVWKDMEFAE